MPHNSELIQFIQNKLYKTYDKSMYCFLIERPLHGFNARLFPDIQVVDKRDRLLCVVEIGYTRPEKIKFYRDNGIQDVRWYSKSGDLINPFYKTEIKTVIQIPDESQIWDRCTCGNEDFNLCFAESVCGDCYSDIINEVLIEKCHEYCFLRNQDFLNGECIECFESCECIRDEFEEEVDLEILSDYELAIYSNGKKFCAIVFCDRCGGSQMLQEEDLETASIWDGSAFDSNHELERLKARQYRKNKSEVKRGMTYTEIFDEIREWYRIEIEYDKLLEFKNRYINMN